MYFPKYFEQVAVGATAKSYTKKTFSNELPDLAGTTSRAKLGDICEPF